MTDSKVFQYSKDQDGQLISCVLLPNVDSKVFQYSKDQDVIQP